MSDPLAPESLLATLPTLLPPGGGSSPLPRPTDAVAALVHTIHVALGFRLQGGQGASANTDETEQTSEAEVDDTASETTTAVDPDEGAGGSEVLSQGWNARGEDAYTFTYRHEQSAMVFHVRVGRMGGRVQVDAMAEVGIEFTE